MKTTTKVKKWGNSLAIRLPKSIAQDLGLVDDSQLEIVSDGKVAIIRHQTTKALSLDDMLKGVTPQNVHEAIDWGEPIGNEIW